MRNNDKPRDWFGSLVAASSILAAASFYMGVVS